MTKPELLPCDPDAAVEWARKVSVSRPPRYTDASRNAAAFILNTRPTAAPDVGLVGEELFAIEPQSGVAAGVYYWIPEGLRNRILTALSASGAGWRDIATAPKDGTFVLLWDESIAYMPTIDRSGFVRTGRWVHSFGFGCADRRRVTHWQPLPLPPQEAGQ